MLSRERGNLILAKAKRKFGVANFADVAGSYGKIDWSQFMLTPNIRQMARIESRSFMALSIGALFDSCSAQTADHCICTGGFAFHGSGWLSVGSKLGAIFQPIVFIFQSLVTLLYFFVFIC